MKLFIFTGHTGIDKEAAAESLLQALPEDQASSLHVCNLRDNIQKLNVDFKAFLENPDIGRQQEIWSRAISASCEAPHLEQDTIEHSILLMNSTYYRRRMFSTLGIAKLAELCERFSEVRFITLIDDVFDVRYIIHTRDAADPALSSLRLREIATWRAAEIMVTDFAAQELKRILSSVSVSHCLFAAKHSPENLGRLLLDPNKCRVYTCSPITQIRECKEKRIELNAFATRVFNEGHVVFNPLTIDEEILRVQEDEREDSLRITVDPETERTKQGERNRWPLDSPSLLDGSECQPKYPLRIPLEEAREGSLDTHAQVEPRDFRYIDQADCVVAYRPNWGGQPSTGAKTEMDYTRHTMKRLFIYFPQEDGDINGSPFVGFGQSYRNADDLLEELKRFRPPRLEASA